MLLLWCSTFTQILLENFRNRTAKFIFHIKTSDRLTGVHMLLIFISGHMIVCHVVKESRCVQAHETTVYFTGAKKKFLRICTSTEMPIFSVKHS